MVKDGLLETTRNAHTEKTMSERIFYRVSEISELIGCSKSKAYELVASGTIPSTHIGTLLRVPRSALDEFIKRAGSGDTDALRHGEPERPR
jgi:excisionase family DNA binding protein